MSTRTYAILEVTPEVYASIRELLAEAGYEHAFHKDGAEDVIDMHGIALKVAGGGSKIDGTNDFDLDVPLRRKK
jgi:hypothetical protein